MKEIAVTLTILQWAAVLNALEEWDSTAGNEAAEKITSETGVR